MLFLAAVPEREFPVSVRNIEISSESGMFLILRSEDSKIELVLSSMVLVPV